MNRITTNQDGVVIATQGNISVEINGQPQLLAQGQSVPQGSTILLDDGMDFQIELADGSIQSPTTPESDEAALAEIEALQDIIAAGEDPTEDLPETAAGGPQGNQGGSAFTSLERSANETLADTAFDTQGLDQNIIEQQFEETSVNDHDSQLISDSNTVAEDSIATGNVLTNDADADSSLSVISYSVNGQTANAGDSISIEGGTLVINSDGSYSFTPAADWNGTLPTITYTTNTGSNAELTIEVTPVDDPSVLQNDSNTIAEGGVATGNVLSNDSDIDNTLSISSYSVNGQTITAGTSVNIEGGTLVINSDGSYSFSPAADWNGTLPTITYTTNTGSNAALTIEVTPVDDPSVLQNDSNTIAEGGVATGNVLSNDSDIDNTLSITSYSVNGQTITAGTSVNVEGGTLVINSDGSYSFTPAADWNGTLPTITYTTNTGSNAELTIEVTPVDDPSELQNDSNTIAEGGVATGNVLSNDSDIDNTLSITSYSVNGQTITAGTSVNVEGGTLVINSDGSYSFTPAADWNGTLPTITYTTNTGSNAELTIEVTPVDDPSELQNDSNTIAEGGVATGNVLSNDSDIDNTLNITSYSVNGQTITAGTSVNVEGGTLVINSDGSYSFTPAADWNGTLPTITYTTNTGSNAELTIEVTPVDDPSELQNDSNTIAEGGVATGNVLSNDSDIDNTLSISSYSVNGQAANAGDSISIEGGTLVINSDGSYSFTPAADWNGTLPTITYTTNTGSNAALTIEVTPVDDPSVLQNDSNTIAEGDVATGNVLSNDSDIDNTLSISSYSVNGQTITAGTSVNIEGGTLVINSDGSYSFTPAADWNGTLPTITYTTNTGSNAELTIEVTPVDDPSVLQNDSNTIAEGGVATGNVLSNDSDIDNTLSITSYSVNGQTANAGDSISIQGGSLVINSDGSYSFTPAADWNGTLPTITYTTNTGSNAELTIEVTPVDDPSVLQNDSNTIAEGGVATGNVLSNDSDIDNTLSITSYSVNGQTITAGTSVNVEGGSLVINSDGSYSFTPAADWNGTLPTITYTTNTGSNAALTIEVTPVDDPSVLENDSNTIAEGGVATGNVLSNDSDIDNTLSITSYSVNGQTITAGTSVNVEGGSLVINSDGSYSFTPAADWNGTLPTITYTTNTGSNAELTIEVTPVDDPSVLQNDSNTIAEGGVATGNVLSNDSDIDNTLSITSYSVNGQTANAGDSISIQGGSLVINSDGSYSFTPAADWNGTLPTITYTTNTGSNAELTIEVTPVDDPSVLQNDSNTIAEGGVATGNVLSNDSDIDNTLSITSYSVNGQTANAGDSISIQGGSLVINSDGSYSFTPAADWNGTLPTITYTTNTGSNAELTIEVTPVDDPSVLQNDSNTIAEGGVATGNVLSNDSDIDNTLSISSYSVNGQTITAGTSVNVEGGTLVINSDGSYSFTPAADWNGTLPTITYTTNTGSNAELTIEVTPVDDPSVLQNDSNTIAEGGVATGNVLSNDSDIDNTLSISSYSVNGQTITAGTSVNVEGGTLVINSDGSYSFTPAADWNGTLPTITYTTNTGSNAELTIEVTPVDDPSELENDSNTVVEDQIATGNVLSNDSDVDSTLQVTSFSVFGQTATAGSIIGFPGGHIQINSDGSYTFTPFSNWNGVTPAITYTTNTGETAELKITVTPDNDAPIAQDDVVLAQEDTEFTSTVNLTSNDSDPEGDNITVVAGTYTTAQGGTITINADGSYSYQPPQDFNGLDTFEYTISDGEFTDTATLSIFVQESDDPSKLQNDRGQSEEDHAVTGNVLSNDSDVDDTLTVDTYSVNGQTANAGDSISIEGGTLVINSDGSYSFTPATDWNGTLPTITYTANTGSNAELTIEITPVDDPSVLQNDSNTVVEDQIATGNVLSNDSDVDSTLQVTSFSVFGQTATAGSIIGFPGGHIQINSDGSYTFTPFSNWNGVTPAIAYTTNTGETAELKITVTPDNDAPIAQDDVVLAQEDTEFTSTVNLTSNDSDPEDNNITVVEGTYTTAQGGTITINADGSYSYQPPQDFNGLDTFEYTISDGEFTDTATLSIFVQESDDPSKLQNDRGQSEEDHAVTGNVLSNDSDVDDTLTVDTYSVNGQTANAGDSISIEGGTLVINSDGSYSFTPAADWNGTLPTITYTTNTGSNAELTIEVTPVDDPSVLENDSNTVVEDQTLTVSADDGLLSNDDDIDSELQVASIQLQGDAANKVEIGADGSASITIDGKGVLTVHSDGGYSFVPVADFDGELPVFEYTTNTGETTTLTLTMNAQDDEFNDENDTLVIDEDSGEHSGRVFAEDLRSGDGEVFVESFSIAGHSGPFTLGENIIIDDVGNFTLNRDGSYSFEAVENYNGDVPVISYVLSDGHGETVESTLTVEINPVNDDFNDNNESITIEKGTELSGNLIDVTSPDGPITIVKFTVLGSEFDVTTSKTLAIAGFGTLTIHSDGKYTFTPESNSVGDVPTITYEMTDGSGNNDTSTLDITIEDTTPPTAPIVEIIDDLNNDGVLTQDEMQDDGVQVKVTIDHDELLLGGQVNISVVLDTVPSGRESTSYTAVLVQGNLVVTNQDGEVVNGFNYDATTGVITWSEQEPEEGERLSVKVDQQDGANNHSESITDTAVVEIVPEAPTLELNSDDLHASLDFEGFHSSGFRQNITVAQLSELSVGDWGTANPSGTFEIGTAASYLNAAAAAGHSYVLELENYRGDNSLYLDVDLKAGRTYSFDFETAARNGSSASNSNFKLIFEQLDEDGNPTGEIWSKEVNFANTNEWQQIAETITVDTTGKYRISFEANNANSVGALLDNISLSEQINQGYENSFIKISEISAALTDTDETLTLSLSNLPAGTIVKGLLLDGSQSEELVVGADGTISIPANWNYSSIMLQVSEAGIYNIDVTATSTESDGSSASTSTSFDIAVYAEGYDPSQLQASDIDIITNAAGGTIDIPEEWLINANSSSSDLELLRVIGADYENGVITVDVSEDGDASYTITDGTGLSEANIDVSVTASNFLSGDDGNDVIIAQEGAASSFLSGLQGDDILQGNSNNESLFGGDGNDLLVGGNGDDKLYGGAGADTFLWQQGETGQDLVNDFNSSEDTLDLSDLLQGEEINDLENYLSFRHEGNSTFIDIDVDGDGNGIDQTIELNGIDLTSDNTLSDEQIIQGLLNDEGHAVLIVDSDSVQTNAQAIDTQPQDEEVFPSGNIIP